MARSALVTFTNFTVAAQDRDSDFMSLITNGKLSQVASVLIGRCA